MVSATFSEIPPKLLNENLRRFLNGELHELYPLTDPYQHINQPILQYQKLWNGTQHREILVEVLKSQYALVDLQPLQKQNIQSLASGDTFTVTTGQQIHPFLGPAFVWAKIQTTLLHAKEIQSRTGKNIVPIFWMASEDHDFDEIKTIPFLGKSYTWNCSNGGAVGRLDTEGIQEILGEMKSDFQHDERVITYLSKFEGIYKKGVNLSQATRNLIQIFFADKGLLVLDPDDARLKSLVKDVWLREIEINHIETLSKQALKMKDWGIKTPITPRQTGLFYLANHFRWRIDKISDDAFSTPTGEFQWSKIDLEQEIKQFPEKFSPNALLRPVYQQTILPNLIYVGGPAECMYWLQVPTYIESNQAVVPVLTLRILMNFIPSHAQNKIESFPWNKESWFEKEDVLIDRYMESELGNVTLSKQIPPLTEQFERIWESLYQIKYPELKSVKKQHEEILKQLKTIQLEFLNDGLESYLSPKIKQIKQLKSNFFNENQLSERKLFWIEWEFKLNSVPELNNLEGPFLWLTN